MNNKKHATELHSEHREWINALSFYQDDLKVMRNRLEEVVKQNTSGEVLAQAEHFQNQFLLQGVNIDTLKHKINEHEAFIQRDITLNPTANNHRLYADSPQLREEVSVFEKTFNELRKEYVRFLSKTF